MILNAMWTNVSQYKHLLADRWVLTVHDVTLATKEQTEAVENRRRNFTHTTPPTSTLSCWYSNLPDWSITKHRHILFGHSLKTVGESGLEIRFEKESDFNQIHQQSEYCSWHWCLRLSEGDIDKATLWQTFMCHTGHVTHFKKDKLKDLFFLTCAKTRQKLGAAGHKMFYCLF